MEIFESVSKVIIEDLIKELKLQGHSLTGALEESITAVEIKENGSIVLTAKALAYIEQLEKGVPGEHISLDSKSIAEMTRYVELRMGYKGTYAMQVAVAILKKQQKEGMPTQNSYNFSQTGERKFAVEDTFYNNDSKYYDLIDPVITKVLDRRQTIKSGKI